MSISHEKSNPLESFYAQSLGRELIKWVREYDPHLFSLQINTDAVLLLKEIQRILDDETLDDPECFYRIDAIISAFHRAGLDTTRHWELE